MALDLNHQGAHEELMDCAHCGGEAIMLPHHFGEGLKTRVFVIECSSQDCFIRTFAGCVSTITRTWNRRDGP